MIDVVATAEILGMTGEEMMIGEIEIDMMIEEEEIDTMIEETTVGDLDLLLGEKDQEATIEEGKSQFFRIIKIRNA